MAFTFTVTNTLYDVSVNSTANNVVVTPQVNEVVLNSNATIIEVKNLADSYKGAWVSGTAYKRGDTVKVGTDSYLAVHNVQSATSPVIDNTNWEPWGGVSTSTYTTATITDLVVPAGGSVKFQSTSTSSVATISRSTSPGIDTAKYLKIEDHLQAVGASLSGELAAAQIFVGAPLFGTDSIYSQAGDITLQRLTDDGNLNAGGYVKSFNGFYAGSVQVIDNNGYWVGPAITDSPQESVSGITGTTQTQIDSFSVSSYDTVKYFLKLKDGSDLHIVEIILAYDGTDVLKSEYGVITNNGTLGTFTADVVSGNVRLLFTPNGATDLDVKVEKTLMAV